MTPINVAFEPRLDKFTATLAAPPSRISSSEGLRTGTGFMPTDKDTKVVRYTGNTDLINSLLMQVDDGQTKVAGKSDAGIPKGQYGFNFQGTPLPVMETFPIMEEQTTMSPNPDFNFMSLLSPQT